MSEPCVRIKDNEGYTWNLYPEKERIDGYSRNLVLSIDKSEGGGYWVWGATWEGKYDSAVRLLSREGYL